MGDETLQAGGSAVERMVRYAPVLNYKTYVVTTETNTKKAQGGKRVMYTSHHPCWDAKNRHGLPEEMDLDFENIATLFKTNTSLPLQSRNP